jgi:Glycosyltransferase family 10 (fucosyltransferase) C-term
MTLVRIAKNWDTPDLLRQTPGGRGEWDGIRFTLDAAGEADYVVVLNYAHDPLAVDVPAEHLWALIQEPSIRLYQAMHATTQPFARVYTQTAPPGGETRNGTLRLPSQPALPWHVDRSYDELVSMEPPEKTLPLSAITSDLAALPGHRARLRFLAKVRDLPELDRFGRGVRPLADKWDGLAPYRYSLAIENALVPNYWTEKLADCFLAWTLPLYAGCPNLEEFFPAESFVRIDLDDPDAPRLVAEIARGRLWEERREAIAEARRRVLEEHQLFPFLAREIRAHEEECENPPRERIVVPGRLPTPLLLRPLASTKLRRFLVRALSRGFGLWLRVRG